MRTQLQNHNYRTEQPIIDRYGDAMGGLDDYCDEMQELYNELKSLKEATRYAMQRMETIRETNPEISLDSDIEMARAALNLTR